MTIKKIEKDAGADSAEAVLPAGLRYNPDMPSAASAGAGAKVAVVAGLVALIVAGVLTFMLYQHWQFLANA